jgi:hypothetical protein
MLEVRGVMEREITVVVRVNGDREVNEMIQTDVPRTVLLKTIKQHQAMVDGDRVSVTYCAICDYLDRKENVGCRIDCPFYDVCCKFTAIMDRKSASRYAIRQLKKVLKRKEAKLKARREQK